jgi:MFS transporter, DHA3 family, macrolide efflux protein
MSTLQSTDTFSPRERLKAFNEGRPYEQQSPMGSWNTIAFFASYLLSAFGYEFVFFISILQIFNATGNPVLAGLLTAFTVLPKCFSPFYGVITDRFRKETVFRSTVVLVGVLIVLMGFAPNLPLRFAFWFLISFGLAMISNARTVMMTEILPDRGYINGNVGILVSLNVAKLFAPLLGGVLVSTLQSRSLYFLAASFYLMAVLSSAFLDLPEPPRKQQWDAIDFVKQVRGALLYVRCNANLMALRYLLWTKALFLGFQLSLYVVYVKSYLNESDFHFGLFMTVISVGSITGALIASLLGLRLRNLKVIVGGLTFQYASLIGLGFIRSYPLALGLMFSSFVFYYISTIALHSVRDTSTRHDIRGTVYGSVSAIGAPLNVFSMLLGTWLAGRYGVEKVYVVGGALAMLSMFAIVLTGTFKISHEVGTVGVNGAADLPSAEPLAEMSLA